MAKTQVWNQNALPAGIHSAQTRIDRRAISQIQQSGLAAARSRATATLGSSADENYGNTAATANVAIIDVSGSTGSPVSASDPRSKLDGIKEAASLFTTGSPRSSLICFITMATLAKILWPFGQVGNNKLPIITAIQGLKSDGVTSMKTSLELALRQFAAVPKGYVLRLYLLTDGLSTDGDPAPLAEQLKAQHVQVQTIGFGNADAMDEELLTRMASTDANGNSLYQHFTNCQCLSAFMKRESRTLTA